MHVAQPNVSGPLSQLFEFCVIQGNEFWAGGQETRVQVLVLSATDLLVILGKSLPFSRPQSPYLQNDRVDLDNLPVSFAQS